MICVTIQGRDLDGIFEILDRPEVEMAEIRLDRCELDDEEITTVFSGTDVPLIATCRLGAGYSSQEVEHRLSLAIEAGAKYVDLEIEAPAPMGKRLGRLARETGTIFIRSYHDFDGTPSLPELVEIVDKCHRFGGEIAKVAVKACSAADVKTVQDLYKEDEEGHLVAFCMGEEGRSSRLDCLAWGSPFSYAALSEGEEAAPGQIPFAEMADALYGDSPCASTEVLAIAASKSFAQRAILAAALAEGTSHLSGYSPCQDSESAIVVARAMGASVHKDGSTLHIKGIGPLNGPLDIEEVHVGESGLLTRLMIPVLAQISATPVRVTGEGTLVNRPLSGANDIMASFGVVLKNCGRTSRKDVFVPLEIEGRLMPGRADISGRGGSQLISGLLMALPLSYKNSAIFVHDPRSIPYIFITLDVLRKFGVNIGNEMEGDEEFVETQDWSLCTAINFKIKGEQQYKAADFDIEGDWSGAAGFMVAGAIFGGVHLKGLDTSSLQADLSIMDILIDAGASVSQDEDGTINVLKAPLNAFQTDLNNAPDLFPVVAMLACFCPGESRIAGVGRLANKESNRGAALQDMLTAMGVEVSIEGDEMVIMGHSLSQRRLTGNLLRGGEYSSLHDHRLVMALKIASMGADAPVVIDDESCVSKSYPSFVEDFDSYFGIR